MSRESKRKFDGKPIMGLLPPGPLFEISDIASRGSVKYEKYGWFNNETATDLYDGLVRHLNKWYMGIDTDPEWGTRHLAHAACRLIMIMALPEEADDRFWKGKEIPEHIKKIIEK